MDKMFTSALKSKGLLRRFLGRVLPVILLLAGGLKAQAQYTFPCTSNLGGGGSPGITNVTIQTTTLNNSTGTSTGPTNYYTSYPASGSSTAILTLGSTYTLDATFTTNAIASVWIDFDQDGSFAASEWVQLTTSATSASVSITIPASATPGTTGMRVRSRGQGNPNGSGDACTQFFSGETEDYTVTLVSASPCTSMPSAVLTASATAACAGSPFTLVATPNALSGLTYVFEVSTNGGTTWSALGTGTPTVSPVYTVASQTVASQYRVTVTCAGNGSNTSAPVSVSQNPVTACYCTPSGNNASYYISGFSTTGGIANISNTGTLRSTNGYGQFLSQIVSQNPLGSVNFTATYGSAGNTFGLGVWVDWNQNGNFSDPGEEVFSTTTYATTHSGSFTVPITAAVGQTRMRIGNSFTPSTGPADPCGVTNGEFEDYVFDVIALTPCSGTPSAALTTASTNACPNASFTLLATPNSQGGLSYVFEASTNGGTTWTTLASGASPGYTVTSQTVTTQYRVTVTCAGGGTNTSAPLTITQNPPNVCYCIPSSTATDYYITDFSTTGGASNVSNLNSGLSPGGYGQFTSQIASQVPGQTVNFSANFNAGTFGFNSYGFAIWIDWNQNGSFADPGEQVFVSSSYSLSHTGSFTVPLTAVTGPTRMRIVADEFNSAPSSPCQTNSTSAEFEDYTFIALPPCNGMPVTGTIVASPAVPCLGDSVTLNIPNGTFASNLGYRWEWSSDGIAWFSGNGAPGAGTDTFRSFGVRPTGVTYYRITVKCRTTNDSVTSAPITVTPLSITLPYFEDFETITTNNQLPPCMKATDPANTNLTFITPQGVGRRNHTPGGNKYGSFSFAGSNSIEQFFFTPGLPLKQGVTYAIRFWYVGDGSNALLSTRTAIGTAADAAAMTNTLGQIANASLDTTYKQVSYYYTPTTAGTYFVGIGNAYFTGAANGFFSIDDIGVDSLPPCVGMPARDTVITTATSFCPGSSIDFSGKNFPQFSNIIFNWLQNGSVAPLNTNAHTSYTTPPLSTAVVSYSLETVCASALGTFRDTTAPFTITPYKAVLPYQETFEGIAGRNDLPTCFNVTDLNTGTWTTTGVPAKNHTPGGNKIGVFGAVNGSNTEWMFTPMMTLQGGLTYQFSFWYRTSGNNPFPILQAAAGFGPSAPQMTFTVGTGVVNAGTTTYQQYLGLFTPTATGDFSFGINTTTLGTTADSLYIDDLNIVELPPCAATPTSSITPVGPLYLCPTDSFTLTAPLPTNSNLSYLWEYKIDTVIGSPNNISLTPPGIINTRTYSALAPTIPVTYYRLLTICDNTNDTARSNYVEVNVNVTIPKLLPYVSDLEIWVDNCDNKDVPADSNWLQTVKTGNSSWRRSDQGSTAGWAAPNVGSYIPPARSGRYSARFHSSRAATASAPNGPEEGKLDMYLNCGPGSPNKALYFYHIAQGVPTSALDVRVSDNGGATWTTVASFDSAADWRLRRVPFVSTGLRTIVRFAARHTTAATGNDVGIDSIFAAPPCTGQPVAGTIGSVTPTSICPGDSAILNLTGTSMAGDLQIEWETSTTSAAGPFTSQTPAGSGGYRWSSGQLMQTTWVRAKVTCGGSSAVDSTNVVVYNLAVTPGIVYATLPVTENFESWTDRCGLQEIPSANWANIPSFGNRSWRRNDQGTTGAWTTPLAGQWWPATPTAAVDSFAARFHNAAATPDGSIGSLNLYANCSSVIGSKELRFFVNMSDRTAGNTDTLRVLYSTDGGFTYNQLDTIRSTNGWEQKVYVLPSDSSKTIVRFEAFSQTTQKDIGLDYVQVLNPCTGTPTAGIVNPVPNVCPGRTFRLSATGTSQQGGLTYFWQSSTTSATTGFSPVGGRQQSVLDTNIAQNTWFRLVVSCSAGGTPLLDTSAAVLVQIADSFHCYCITNAQYPYVTSQFKENIGRATIRNAAGITLMTNGISLPINNNVTAVNAYSNFQNLPATPMYRDSTYNLEIQQISYTTNSNAKVVGWIDFNRDGIFDTSTERIVNLTTTAASAPIYKIAGNFTIPSNAKPGITGMRITLQQPFTATLPDPCGTNPGYGETEDYLVELRLAPCSGFTSLIGGTAHVSDTSICPGYPVTLIDTTYQREVSGVTRQWQQTTNNGASWQRVGPINRDTVDLIVQANTRYRFMQLCDNGVESYSNEVSVLLRPASECYCPSYADGGPNQVSQNLDSCDVGSFSIGSYTFQVGGPHLINPQATRKWTNNAGQTQIIELWADSTYDVDIYQIMRGKLHQDAKVTMFIDYNHNLQFDVNPPAGYPSERVLTAFTSNVNYYLNNLQLTTPPSTVLTGDVTLLRIVMNENVGPNAASDNGCGTYTSGETEDYYVTFRCPTCPTGVVNANGSNVSNFSLFPNPTTGIATVQLNTVNAVKEMEMIVTNMTGQVIQKRSFGAQGTQFSTTVDLKDQPRGVYFVEIKADNERIVRKLIVQ